MTFSRSLPFLLLILCAPGKRAEQLAADACAATYGAFKRSLWEDLEPWAVVGVSEALADEALEHTVSKRGDQGLGFLLRGGKLYVVDGSQQHFATVGSAGALKHNVVKWLVSYARVLLRLVELHGAELPDVEFVVEQGDAGPTELLLSRPGPASGPPPLLLRYCKPSDGSEVLIPYHHLYEHAVTDKYLEPEGEALAKYNAPLESRLDVVRSLFAAMAGRACSKAHTSCSLTPACINLQAFGNHHAYARVSASTATARVGADGEPILHNQVRPYVREHLFRWAPGVVNESNVQLNTRHLPMGEWASYRYLIHLDGATCSSKLETELALGSLVLKEESGFRSFYHRLLVPYQHYVPFWRQRPQELLGALAWARSHPAEAADVAAQGRAFAVKWLHKAALRCYWLLLLEELAKLQRFEPGARLSPERLVPAETYIAWAREADGGRGKVLLDLEL